MAAPARWVPQPRARNPCQVSHVHGLASSAFARHYSRNHSCFLFLRVLRCFTSPRYPHHPIHSGSADPPWRVPGFPIRKSSDLSSVDSSPRHIAASHVLHQLLMPRHPPYALNNLTPQTIKDARIHYAILKHQPETPTTLRTPEPNSHPLDTVCSRAEALNNLVPETPLPPKKRVCCRRTQQCATPKA